VREPKVFLFDEPLSNLDAKLRVETRANLSKLHQQLKTTFIYVTHDQIEAMTMASRIAVINRGILQQVDTPSMLYDKPDNLLAGFIGSPAMNFFNAKLVRGDGKLFVDGESFKVEVPASRNDVYSKYVDKPVIMGIRPEDIQDPQYLPPDIIPQPVDGTVDVTELMGNEVQLYIRTGEHTYVARVDPRTKATMGQKIQVVFNMGNMHLFDPETEQAIR
jgi:multiple sugar transport system ATP-binding protein